MSVHSDMVINRRTITVVGRTVVAENARGELFRRHRGKWRRLVMQDFENRDQRRNRYAGHHATRVRA